MAQLCSIDFQTAPMGCVCLTRVADVNCTVLPDRGTQGPGFRFWVDASFGVSFWEILVEVCQ